MIMEDLSSFDYVTIHYMALLTTYYSILQPQGRFLARLTFTIGTVNWTTRGYLVTISFFYRIDV